ncbi:MAG TPA: tetratricopeptide repeat protein [Terracidiphilus sp.]|nr:tetratricopeptide repeat protein [Terracidiphilus sp.]
MFRPFAAGFAGAVFSLTLFPSHNSLCQARNHREDVAFRLVRALAVERGLQPMSNAAIRIDYPQDGSIFPREITPPTFMWHDDRVSVTEWRIEVVFGDGEKPLHARANGERMRIGAIDERCIASSNKLPELTAEQASAHTWKPAADVWSEIKRRSLDRPARVAIVGVDAKGSDVSRGEIALSTSRDPVDGQIFYRDVPLMPSEGKKGIVQPLSPSLLYLINWRVRDIGQPESKVVMTGLHTCGNCHSFSRDGKTMGMDVDGPGNDKGLYAIVPVAQHMSIRTEDTISWNTDLSVGQSRVGFMSQVSPDGRYVLSTLAGRDQSIPSSYFVVNFKDYGFLQVFYPTRGILAWYNRATGRRQALPGADDPQYVQTDGVWSPDGKYVVFARAKARDPEKQGQAMPAAANDPNETRIQYDLYRVPFHEGKGGKAEPIPGASNNGMSNSFPKVSPDGKWIVFVEAKNGQLMRPDSELYIVPAAGGVARRMRCNTSRMNSWHSFSPNGRWMVFSSKSRSPYTQMFLTHIDAQGNDSPPIYIDNAAAANRAVNIPEFVNTAGIESIDVPASDFYRVVDEAMELQSKGDNAGALEKWRSALAMDPKDARANNGIGIVLGVMGRGNEAIPYFQKATYRDADFFEAYYNLGIVLVKENRLNEAAEAWRNTVRIRPEFAQGHEDLGYVLYLGGQYGEAITELRLALKQDPRRKLALTLAASLLATCPDASVRDGKAALELAQRAEQESADRDPGMLDTLSAAYAEAGNFAAAVKAEQLALTEIEQKDAVFAAILRRHLARYESQEPVRTPQDFVAF